MRTMAALLAVAGLAWAQDPPRQDRGTDFWVNMLKDRLKLTEEQAGQVREVLRKDAEERQKMDDARTSKVNELLTEEQKKLYEEMRRNPFGGGGRGFGGFGQGGGQPGGGPGGGLGAMAGRFGQVQMEDLKRELELTDEQAGKIQPIVDDFNAKGQKRAEELRESGFRNLNIQEELQRAQDLVKEAGEKLKPHLTDAQKEKYDRLVEGRMQWVRMAQGFLGARGGGAPPGGGPPRMSPEERVKRVMEALKVEKEDDRKAISDLVTEIVKVQAALEEQNKAVREKLQAMSKNSELSSDAIEDALKTVRQERRQKEKELAGLQKELSEAVNNRQEVELILHGILK